ncbi:lytic transglycosylase domain-containing protein [Asticcacaulis endophyticus]|uniref:Murein transglycosylase n=1 Tax=Asticcacaulis endophyticus TaxID=1395890 RepID=A0A918QCD0_9CAUL|nr:lytic transglycosylase domain-containing protein [Asticcacaulis endophyticus]GGZ40714.1 murein transglycosylase [Asticcacaulis endophyticus]
MTIRPLKTVLKTGMSRWVAGVAGVLAVGAGAAFAIEATQNTPAPTESTSTARPYQAAALPQAEMETLQSALRAAKSGNFSLAESLRSGLNDPVARKIVLWNILDNEGASIYGFATLDAARRDLIGWPRESRRVLAAEKLISTSGISPQQVVDWFNGAPPMSVDGAIALITAYDQLGKTEDARATARFWWRDQSFEALDQQRFYSLFGKYLSQEDHVARLNSLLLGPQGPASRAMLDYVGDRDRVVAQAAFALRAGTADATQKWEAALAASPNNSVLAYERARFLRKKDLEPLGFPLLTQFPAAPQNDTAINNLWVERLSYFREALKAKDYRAAYNAMNNGGFPNGEKKAEAEFFAGWMALTKLNDPARAITHFTSLEGAGTSPITQGRAHYWLGRAYEAAGDAANAQLNYQEGGQYIFSFYGQLAAEKAGLAQIVLTKDPVPAPADTERFNGRDMVKAAKILGSMGERDLFRGMVLALDDVLPNAEEQALLVDLASTYDTQDTAMRIARVSMQRGFYLPERAYPLRAVPNVKAPENAFVLAITRQESGFDPMVRSHANARGMMQLIPPTARAVARRMSLSYSDAKLYEPEFNMTLGAYHLGELVDRFGGSYVMAAAGYNAGPNRPPRWIMECADPRGDGGDPIMFIECAQFTETRNYMMRVMENMQVYRARLNGGQAVLRPMTDLKRGMIIAYTPSLEDDSGSGETPTGPINYLDLKKQGGS